MVGRCEGFADLLAALSEVPAHEYKRQQLVSMLQQTEAQTRSEIAEAARSAAGLRQDKAEYNSFIAKAPRLGIWIVPVLLLQTRVLLSRVRSGGPCLSLRLDGATNPL